MKLLAPTTKTYPIFALIASKVLSFAPTSSTRYFSRASYFVEASTYPSITQRQLSNKTILNAASTNEHLFNDMPDSQTANDKKDAKVAKIWDRFAPGYAKSPIKDEEAYQHKLDVTQEKYLTPSSQILEFGCGTGGTSIYHAPHVKHVLATDISSKMLEIARGKQQEAGVSESKLEFRQASVDSLDLPSQSKDVVLGMSILHLLPNRREALTKVHNWLKPGGYFISSTICIGDLAAKSWGTGFIMKRVLPVVSWCGIIPEIDGALTKDQLRQEMKQAGFEIDYEWQPNPDAAVFMVGKKI